MTKSEFTCKLQIRREAGVFAGADELTVFVNGQEVYGLKQDQLKATFHLPEPAEIVIKNGSQVLLARTIALPHEHILLLSLTEQKQGFFDKIMRRAPSLQINEVSRKYLAAYDPGPPTDIVQQIWLGTTDNKDAFYELMSERDAYWSEENEEAEGKPQHIALSGFAEAMGETWYDHDFLEYGVAQNEGTIEERFKGHSWVNFWGPIVRDRVSDSLHDAANAFIIMGVDTQKKNGFYRQITNPKDIEVDGVSLKYLGEITHKSH